MSLAEPPRRPPSDGSGKGKKDNANNNHDGEIRNNVAKLIAFVNNMLQQQRHWTRDWKFPGKNVVELSSNNTVPKLLVTANFDTMHFLLTTKSVDNDACDSEDVGTTKTMSYELNADWSIKNSKVVG